MRSNNVKKTDLLRRPLAADNPLSVQTLGVCSALAVTTSVETALVMTIAVTFVLIAAEAVISAMRHLLSSANRLIVQITVIASLVILVDLMMQAYLHELSRVLSVFVGLIVTNCLVLGRSQSFAMTHGVIDSMLDGLGNGLGYGIVMLIVGTIRELLGKGSLAGVQILQTPQTGGIFEPLYLAMLSPSAFFIIAGIIWIAGARKKSRESAQNRATSTSVIQS